MKWHERMGSFGREAGTPSIPFNGEGKRKKGKIRDDGQTGVERRPEDRAAGEEQSFQAAGHGSLPTRVNAVLGNIVP